MEFDKVGHGVGIQVEFLDTVSGSKINLTLAGGKAIPNSEAGVDVEGVLCEPGCISNRNEQGAPGPNSTFLKSQDVMRFEDK